MISPAKINWSLRIIGRRKDGYHLIESIFLPILNLSDEIDFQMELNAPLTIQSTGNFAGKIPLNQDNLMSKALQRLGARLGVQIGGQIIIEKKIPVAAGLGGGSSNAGTILISAQTQLGNQGITVCNDLLSEVASTVGSDVTFFLNPTPSLVKGVGELITSIKSPVNSAYALLVTPAFEISAKDAYQLYQQSGDSFTSKGNYNEPINDLGRVVRRKYIALNQIMDQLESYSPISSFISGSGPTCVALYSTKEQAQLAQKSFSQNLHVILTNL